MSKRKHSDSPHINIDISETISDSSPAPPAPICYDIPEELLEIVIGYFFMTTEVDLKNRAALLRTCSKWRRIAEPILWRHIAIVEEPRDGYHPPRIVSLSHILSNQPKLGAHVESLTLKSEYFGAWLDGLSSSGQSVMTKFMINLKSISLHVEAFVRNNSTPEGYSFLTRLLYNCPTSCQSIHFRIDVVGYYPGEYILSTLRRCVHDVCRLARFVRLDLPSRLLSAVFRAGVPNGQYVNLESIVLIWTGWNTSQHLQEANRWQWATAKVLPGTAARGSLPNLKKALLLQPGTERDIGRSFSWYGEVTRLKHKLKLDTLLKKPLIDVYCKTRAAREIDNEDLKVEVQKAGDQNCLSEWLIQHNRGRGVPTEAQFNMFHTENWSVCDLLVRYEELAWVRLRNGSIVPRELLGELKLTWNDIDCYYGFSVEHIDSELGILISAVNEEET